MWGEVLKVPTRPWPVSAPPSTVLQKIPQAPAAGIAIDMACVADYGQEPGDTWLMYVPLQRKGQKLAQYFWLPRLCCAQGEVTAQDMQIQ